MPEDAQMPSSAAKASLASHTSVVEVGSEACSLDAWFETR